MLRKLLLASAVSLTIAVRPVPAVYSDLQVVETSVDGSQVTVQIHNPNSAPESARVRLVVQTNTGSEELTSAAFTVPASGTTSVSVSASSPITGILDDPDPVSL